MGRRDLFCALVAVVLSHVWVIEAMRAKQPMPSWYEALVRARREYYGTPEIFGAKHARRFTKEQALAKMQKYIDRIRRHHEVLGREYPGITPKKIATLTKVLERGVGYAPWKREGFAVQAPLPITPESAYAQLGPGGFEALIRFAKAAKALEPKVMQSPGRAQLFIRSERPEGEVALVPQRSLRLEKLAFEPLETGIRRPEQMFAGGFLAGLGESERPSPSPTERMGVSPIPLGDKPTAAIAETELLPGPGVVFNPQAEGIPAFQSALSAFRSAEKQRPEGQVQRGFGQLVREFEKGVGKAPKSGLLRPPQ